MKYHLRWDRNDYGYIIIEANTEDEAREKFETGEYEEKDLVGKGGNVEVVDIEPVE